MKIVRFFEGLGNQMFQYAFYLSLKERFPIVKADLSKYSYYSRHNGFELEKVFNLNLAKAGKLTTKLYDPLYRAWHLRKLRRLLQLKNAFYSQVDAFAFDPGIYDERRPRLYEGYWQNERYFREVSPLVRKNFTFPALRDRRNIEILRRIKNENSIAIHVRRGDYLVDPLLGNLCSIEYYKKAIAVLTSQIPFATFYIFSDDIHWCKENFNLPSATYVTWNTGERSYIDMQLMSSCRHNIIANSTFSWWGAWLNRNANKIVVAPKKWISDTRIDTTEIIPVDWIRI